MAPIHIYALHSNCVEGKLATGSHYFTVADGWRICRIARHDNLQRFFAGRFALHGAIAGCLSRRGLDSTRQCHCRLCTASVFYSLSHSRAWAVAAASCKQLVGVDVQFVQVRDCLQLASLLNWPSFVERHSASDLPTQSVAFSRAWSRTEALFKLLSRSGSSASLLDTAKLMGDGARRTADSVGLLTDCEARTHLLKTPLGRIVLTDLPIESGYVLALATFGGSRLTEGDAVLFSESGGVISEAIGRRY